MLSLAIVMESCSAAISSRIGAIMRHGPHHSAQKSTRTGLSELIISSNSASVMVTGWLIGVSPCLSLQTSFSGSQPTFGVDRRPAASAGGGHRLSIVGVGHVTGSEHAFYRSAGRYAVFEDHIPGGV